MAIIFYVNECAKYMDDHARADVANYIARSNKFILGGYGVDPRNPAASMKALAESFDKDSGKRLYHFIIALPPNLRVKPDSFRYQMDVISVQVGQKYQVFYGIHTDTKHLHAHMMINAVGNDGMKFRGDWASLREIERIIRSAMYRLGDQQTYMTLNNKVPEMFMDFTG